MVNNYHQRRPRFRQQMHIATGFVVGERVRIVNAPTSYGYNGRAGIVMRVDGAQISVMVDEHPADMRCTAFYVEELEREVAP